MKTATWGLEKMEAWNRSVGTGVIFCGSLFSEKEIVDQHSKTIQDSMSANFVRMGAWG